MYYYLHIGKCL